jgi:hypothetical protein
MAKPSSLLQSPPNTPFKENSSKMANSSISLLIHHTKKTAPKWLNHHPSSISLLTLHSRKTAPK